MPELMTIGGERVLNLTNREAFARSAGYLIDDKAEFEATYNEITQDIENSGDEVEFNNFPVITQEKRFVLPQGGVFSDREIRVALELGHIVCDPAPNPNHGARINGSSIDVTLGRYFYTAGEHDGSGIFNPFSVEDTNRYFDVKNVDTDFLEAKPWAAVRDKVKLLMGIRALNGFNDVMNLEGIPEDHPIILLRPNERILAHTNEFIGILPPGTTAMQARSTTGRIGLSACYCAGWGDPGYVNRWTMEIQNLNENEFIPIPLNYRIAQVVFSMTGPVGREYSQTTGNYQGQDSHHLAAIKDAWRPHFVLPKAYKSEIVMPITPEGLAEGYK